MPRRPLGCSPNSPTRRSAAPSGCSRCSPAATPPRTWRSSCCATSLVCCAARPHVPGSSPPTAPCWPRSAGSSPEPSGPASSPPPRRCCAGTGASSQARGPTRAVARRSEEHTSELQSRPHLVCRLLLEKKKKKQYHFYSKKKQKKTKKKQ